MLAALATHADHDDPLAGLKVGERPAPDPPEGWVTVRVRAAALNHHDLWTLRGVTGSEQRLPIVLGSDAAGLAEDGTPVVVYPVIGDDPGAQANPMESSGAWGVLGSEFDGTFAELVAVPRSNLVPLPPDLTFAEAACLPGAWLTAYRMLFEKAAIEPGSTVLVQGAGGGVATALIVLGRYAGYRVWVTSRSEEKRERALELGAARAFPSGERLPERVDAVFETVGAATWAHSERALRAGGRLVVCGATTGAAVLADLSRVFYRQLSVVGATLGTRDQLRRLIQFCLVTGARPCIDRVLPLEESAEGFGAMLHGRTFGKIVFTT